LEVHAEDVHVDDVHLKMDATYDDVRPRGGTRMRILSVLGAAALLAIAVPAPAHAEGFITPFIGYNFGGDSGNCQSLTNCNDKHTNFGVSLGSMGTIFGFEEDISYAKNFFGEAPGGDNSVFSAMSNLLVGIGVGPVQPYALAGFGLIRPHVSTLTLDSDNNAFGYDLGGGVTVSVAPHIGIRGDIRHFHTVNTIDLPFFTSQRLDFFRASAGLALRS
jgi:opacity protein-like surface antigen